MTSSPASDARLPGETGLFTSRYWSKANGGDRSGCGQAQRIDMASAPTAAEPLRRMHVTRPKSAKGRSRSTPQVSAHNMEAYACRASPTPRVSSPRPPSAPRIAQDDVPGGLHQLPYRPPSSSLNRYRVLPSIGAAGGGQDAEDELVHRTSTMRLSAEARHHRKTLYRETVNMADWRAPEPPQHRGGDTVNMADWRAPEPPQHRGGETVNMADWRAPEPPQHRGGDTVNMADWRAPEPPQHRGEDTVNMADWRAPEPPSEGEPRLLLAIRTHSGQRFERFFRPSDTLCAILAAAEEKTGTSCKDCSVEAMEVPRRSFTDHSRTLQECGIPNKSVLCIQRLGRD